ncbi:MAG: amidohydrolase [bacterium]|nr:amidohydrolase [bacterium]
MTWTTRGVAALALVVALIGPAAGAASKAVPDWQQEIDRLVTAVTPKVVAWRRDLHQHPELGNRETRTAALVAEHLRGLGMEVRTGVAHTGVVAVLRGDGPGPVVALRADIDALPVTEEVDLPFASKVRTTYNGREVGVMHACGHDAHTAILMGVAEVLAGLGDRLPGTVKFLFQPAEEGPPAGEEGGASLMVAEGALKNPVPEAIFALHVMPHRAGRIGYRAGGILAGADRLKITVEGRQTHAAFPWQGVDPIVVASQIVLGLQTIPSRQLDPMTSPAVISIGSIHGGLRSNIIPGRVELEGTVRIVDPASRENVLARIRRTAENIAASAGATASVEFVGVTPVTYNDPELTARMAPTLRRVAAAGAVEVPSSTAAEDFSFFQQQVPGLYFFLGINREGVGAAEAVPNHSPHFYVNEDALPVGVRALASLAVDYLSGAE